ncbi:unnamed protein product [Lampetra planeri]
MTSLKGRCGDLTRKGSVSMTSHGREVSDDVTRSDSVPMTSRGGGRPDDVTHVMASRLPARTGLILLLLPPLLLLPLLSPCQSSAVDREPLSDQKICADAECRDVMYHVKAIRDYEAQDCRFVSFSKDDDVYVYYRLAGQREDLWLGMLYEMKQNMEMLETTKALLEAQMKQTDRETENCMVQSSELQEQLEQRRRKLFVEQQARNLLETSPEHMNERAQQAMEEASTNK